MGLQFELARTGVADDSAGYLPESVLTRLDDMHGFQLCRRKRVGYFDPDKPGFTDQVIDYKITAEGMKLIDGTLTIN